MVVLIFNFAENLLHEVLQGHNSGSAAKLIDHHSHTALLLEQALHHLVGKHRLGGENHRLDALLPVVLRSEKFAHVNVSKHIVDVVAIDYDF